MAIDEASRYRLFKSLEGILGEEEASTLMTHLPPVGWADVATRRDLEQLELRMDARLDGRLHHLESRMLRTILIANSASVLTVGGLAFAAARLV